ncbi:MAG: heme ABC exporter ATP-binding protein CcmA, partial [Gemmatimonadota bacterium]
SAFRREIRCGMATIDDEESVRERGAGRPAVALDGVARRFGRTWPLRGVRLRVGVGELVALTGPNGSGKTTLLRIIATALRPTRGGGRVLGRDLITEADAVRSQIGLVGHSAGLYGDLTANENLRFVQRMLDRSDPADAVRDALEAVGLAAQAERRVREFSAGMRRRLALARLLLQRAPVWLLDEPFASLDGEGAERVGRLIDEHRRAGGGAVIVATHSPERLGPRVDRVVRLEAGRVRSTEGEIGGGEGRVVADEAPGSGAGGSSETATAGAGAVGGASGGPLGGAASARGSVGASRRAGGES